MRAHLGTYPAEFYYSNSRPHKCRTHNYVSTSAENGPAMAGPVRTPMFAVYLITYCADRATPPQYASYQTPVFRVKIWLHETTPLQEFILERNTEDKTQVAEKTNEVVNQRTKLFYVSCKFMKLYFCTSLHYHNLPKVLHCDKVL